MRWSILLLALLFPAVSSAMYCGNKLISRGDPQARVHALCGEPIGVNQFVTYRRLEASIGWRHRRVTQELRDEFVVPVVVEEWLYNFGPNNLLHKLVFVDGYLKTLDTQGYGF